MHRLLENIDGRDDSLNNHDGNSESISGNNQHNYISSGDSNVNREIKHNFTNGPNNNNDEDVASTLSVTGALNAILRRSPQPTLKRKAGEISPVNSSQESSTSSEPFTNVESMNCDSPGRNCSPVYRGSPPVKDVEYSPTCQSDMHLDNTFTTDHKLSNSVDYNVLSDSNSASKSLESKKSQVETETSLYGEKSPISKVTPKVTVSSANSPYMCNDKLSVAKSDIERSSSLKGLERASDSGSRSSAEFTRAHSRERSFEKSLDNIMDKCSEKSLDLNLSVECKNGTLSDKTSVDESNVSKKSDKKKKTAPWYTMWSPSYKSRTDDFKKFFKDVPSDERLIVDYSCALQKDILVHGRMFLTQNWVCFYANIFRWETVLTVPCKEITAVTKEKTARVIPNAIQIATDKEKHFFTSFGARDKTYMMLFRVWQNALLEQPMSPKELWQWVHYSYGEELGLTSSDDDYVAPPSGVEEAVEDNSKCDNTDSSEAVPIGDIANVEEVEPSEVLDYTPMDKTPTMASIDLPTDQSDTTDDSEGEVVCTTDHNHFCKQMLFTVYHIPVEKLFDLLYTDTAFIQSVHLSKRNTNLAVSPWQDDTNGSGNRHRTLSYTVALNYSIGPKSSHTFEKQMLYKLSKPGSLYVVDTECSMAGIPYADAFVVVNRFCISRVTHHKSRLRITTEIQYKKSVWGLAKSMIEKNGYQGSEDFFKTLDAHLKREVENLQQETNKGSQTQSLKRKLRKRRTRTNQTNIENTTLKQTKPGMSRHLSLMENKQSRHTPQTAPPSPIRFLSHKEEKLTKLNADTLVRVILVVLVLLVIFNAILFYKLWSLEGFATMLYSPHSPAHVDEATSPKSQEEWASVLKQQQYLYEREIDKWKEILSSSITLIDQMKLTLVELRNSLENRLSTKDVYQMHEA
ncbi:protein Aster-B-like isoform X2 [Pecten maximus]|uniref:protein Aster-B-like isoform X2 n=1 Tax=Pecten maximus TaxID=6579 RepID=UPI001458D625|nr:protein Aster-B-like isoform X2 [Pecten maximus]